MATLPLFAAEPRPEPPCNVAPLPGVALPPHVEAVVWRATELGELPHPVVATGWRAFDDQLPGGGWPCRSVCEVLTSQPSIVEWRLLGPALRQACAEGGQVAVVAPPRHPHLPGLVHDGIDDRRLVWIQAQAPAERLWVTEQLIQANACRAIVAWLPQARPEQLRRLQVSALGHEGLVFLCRPEAACHEASAAPLRVHATFGLDWELRVQILKRRGPACAELLRLPSVPGGLAAVITPRLRQPSRLLAREVPADAVGRPAVSRPVRRHATAS